MADATTAQDTQEKSRYEVTIKDLGAAKKRLSITVPADLIDEKIPTGTSSRAGFRTMALESFTRPDRASGFFFFFFFFFFVSVSFLASLTSRSR